MNIKYINNNKTTKFNEDKKVPFITFDIFSKYHNQICHGFSTRLGGVSADYLSSLNLSYNRGDNPLNVTENHKRFAEAVGYNYKNAVFSDQVHLTNIKKCTIEDAGKGIDKKSDIKDIDGLVTDVRGLPLMTFYADCVPLFFYDPVKKVVATAHSGWRGTVSDMGGTMVRYMEKEYGCNAMDIICAIGPSICKDCYEVSSDVIDEMKKIYTSEEINMMTEAKGDNKFQLDLHMACTLNFIKAGIKKENIGCTDICTCCNPDLLYSHRASHGKRGNLAGIIMLK